MNNVSINNEDESLEFLLRKIYLQYLSSVEYLTDERKFSGKGKLEFFQMFLDLQQIEDRSITNFDKQGENFGTLLGNLFENSFTDKISGQVSGKLSRAIGYQRDYPRQKRQSTFSSQAGKKSLPSILLGRNTVQHYRSPHLHFPFPESLFTFPLFVEPLSFLDDCW